MAEPRHLPDEVLLEACDGQPAPAAHTHLAACPECRKRLDDFRSGVEEYTRYHRSVLKPSLPPPPRPWPKLRLEEPRRPALVPFRLAWLAAAAGLLLAVLAMWRFRPAPPLEANELLVKASLAEPAPSAARRIRVRSRTGTLIRPAVWIQTAKETAAEKRLGAMFRAAGYSWEEPLSARSYLAWAKRLARKQESVRKSDTVYLVRTTTDDGPLVEATLALRESDLHAIESTLRFEPGEVVEISEVEPAPAVESPARQAPPAEAPERPSRSRELEVLAALHRIGADLGDPIQIEPRGQRVLVSGVGMGSARREEIERALAHLDYVALRFEAAAPVRPEAGPRAEQRAAPAAGRVRAEVEARLGETMSYEQFVEEALAAGDAVLARAHALRSLAARFPAEDGLSQPDRELLQSLRNDHAGALKQSVERLSALAQAGFGITVRAAEPPARAPDLLAAARQFDALWTAALTGGAADVPGIETALVRLRAEAAALESER